LSEISNINFSHKLFLLPILLGGSLGPFFFIALLSDYFYPAISAFGFLSSLLALFIGFSGKKSFRIEMKNDVHEIFLSSVSDNLREFVTFVNEISSGMDKEEILTFYLPLTKEMEKELLKKGMVEIDKEGIFSETSKDYHVNKNNRRQEIPYVKIHYKTPHIRIKFEKNVNGKLKPRIFGFISKVNEIVYS